MIFNFFHILHHISLNLCVLTMFVRVLLIPSLEHHGNMFFFPFLLRIFHHPIRCLCIYRESRPQQHHSKNNITRLEVQQAMKIIETVNFTSNFRSVFIHERRCGPDDSIRCWTFDRAGRVIIAPRAALPDNYRIIPLVLGCVFLCRIFLDLPSFVADQ